MEPQDVERRLAAILAADVVGYSRLMEADEPGTLAGCIRRKPRKYRDKFESMPRPEIHLYNNDLRLAVRAVWCEPVSTK